MITALLLSPALDVTYRVSTLEAGGIHRPYEVHRLPGGKGLNLARAATRLGARCRVVAPLGGSQGESIARRARAAGIETIVVPVAGEARTCITVFADDADGATEFYEPAPELDAGDLERVREVLVGLESGGWTVLSGSIPGGVGALWLVGALRERAESGDRIGIDSHGPQTAELVTAVRPSLVKVNRAEAVELTGHDAEPLELAVRLRDATGGVAIVTDGARGSAAASPEGVWRLPAPLRIGRYAVGSGDSYLAGLLAALERGDGLPEALRLASAVAAANAEEPGAAEFEMSALDALLEATPRLERIMD